MDGVSASRADAPPSITPATTYPAAVATMTVAVVRRAHAAAATNQRHAMSGVPQGTWSTHAMPSSVPVSSAIDGTSATDRTRFRVRRPDPAVREPESRGYRLGVSEIPAGRADWVRRLSDVARTEARPPRTLRLGEVTAEHTPQMLGHGRKRDPELSSRGCHIDHVAVLRRVDAQRDE